ncbi:hypothetical protein [Reichenbachiella sp.]|uniref:hypothetical protein n=1 Tax=Reichenbachiella sp. TaxID=2184521 RepID=UPI003B59C67A
MIECGAHQSAGTEMGVNAAHLYSLKGMRRSLSAEAKVGGNPVVGRSGTMKERT